MRLPWIRALAITKNMAAAVTEIRLPSTLARSSPSAVVGFEPRRSRPRRTSAKVTTYADDHSALQSPIPEDPLKILAPAQKKLATIESQRVMSVVEDTMKRIEGVVLLPVLMESLERFSVPLGSELVSLFEEYRKLVKEYNRLEANLEAQGIEPKVEGSTTTVEGSVARLLEAGQSSSHVLKLGGISEHSAPGVGSGSTLHSDTGSSARLPRRLEPLTGSELLLDEEAMEERFQELRVQLRHVVRCILRALYRNSSTASILQTLTTERPKTGSRLISAVE